MENDKDETVFKVPKLLIGPRPGIKKTVKCVDTNVPDSGDDAPTTNTTVDTTEEVEVKLDQSKKIVRNTSQVPIPYEEPSWGGRPGEKYFLEVCIIIYCCF